MLGNYFKPNSKKVMQISMALKGFIGTIAGATLFSGNATAAFWFMAAGAFLDFLIQCFDPGDGPKSTGAGKAVAIIAILSLSFLSCNTTKRISETTRQDSTWTTYKTVYVKVDGTAVSSGISIDSLVMDIKNRLIAATGQPENVNVDSLLTVALSTFKDEMKGMSPTVITDPESKVQLKYWYDQYGKLNMECSSKDQTIQMLVAEINKLTKEKKIETVIKEVSVWYTWAFMGWAVFATILCVLLFIVRK